MEITTTLLIASAITGIIGLVYVCILIRSILKASRGTQCMSDISEAISLGAQAFIKREYLYLGICVVGIAILMGIFLDYRESITFLYGVVTLALVCWLGISISTRSNCRSCNLAVISFPGAFKVAYSAGAMMGRWGELLYLRVSQSPYPFFTPDRNGFRSQRSHQQILLE